MTPELAEFRKWGVVAGLIEQFSNHVLEPVVLNTDGIGMLIIYEHEAFFFYSHSREVIIVQKWKADADEMISSSELFSTPMQQGTTFREIAHLAIAKILS